MPDCFVLCFCIHLCVRFRHPQGQYCLILKECLTWRLCLPNLTFQVEFGPPRSSPRFCYLSLQGRCRELQAYERKIPLNHSNTPHSICCACVGVSVCACSLLGAVYIGHVKSCNLISSFYRVSSTPHPPCSHPPLNTKSYWRKRVVTSLRHAGVSACGSGGQRGL